MIESIDFKGLKLKETSQPLGPQSAEQDLISNYV